MSYYLSKTGGFHSNGVTDPSSRKHAIKFKLVSTDWMDTGRAWEVCWNQLRLKYPIYEGCKLASVDVEGIPEAWGQCFNVTANYEREEEMEEQLWATISFSTRGGREKKLHSLATQSYKATTAVIPAPPDFKNAIGYNNGVFDGVDIVTPSFGFSLDVDLPGKYFTTAQFVYFHGLTGSTNANPFWFFQAEECLFTGVNGNSYRKYNEETKTYELWYRLSFEFEAMPSLANTDIPPFENVTKAGMHYLWVLHQDQKEETSGVTVPTPQALYVERVYPMGDFSWFTMLKW